MIRRWAIVGCLALSLAAADKETQKAKRRIERQSAPAAPAFDVPQPFIAYVFPAGVRCGESVEATISGTNLAPPGDLKESQRVTVSGAGVTARLLSAKDNTQLRVRIEADASAEPGERELRIVSPGGASNRFRFFVGELPEVIESEPNSEKTQPQVLPRLPVVINGQIQEADRDFFRFHARAGEKLVLEVQARRILPFIADGVPGWFDPCLTVYDATGREVGYADDFRVQSDPVLVFEPPRDGDYTLEVRDILHRGRGDFVYRLMAGAVPFVSHIFPLGGQRGSTVEVELTGVNLASARQRVEVAAGAPPRFAVGRQRFAACDFREQIEGADFEAYRVEPPLVLNGRIGRPGDVDSFVIRAAPKQQLVFEVQARRLDSPLDSILRLMDRSGKVLAESDDWQDPADSPATHHADSRILYTFSTGGEFVMQLGDVQGNGGPEYAYRLIIAPPQPDFSLRISPDNPRLGQGDTAALTVDAVRKDGFDGEIRLSVENLPEGFRASDAVIQPGQSQARFTITAPPDAPVSVLSPAVVGTATVGGREVRRRAETADPMMQAFASTHYMPTAGLAMAVLEPGAFTLSAGDGKVLEAPRGSEISISVKVRRTPAAKGAVTLTGTRIGNFMTMKPAVCPPGADEAVLTVAVSADAPVGLRQNLIVSGVTRNGRDTITRFAPAIPIRIVDAVK